jgi:gliding motility-associated-like protein
MMQMMKIFRHKRYVFVFLFLFTVSGSFSQFGQFASAIKINNGTSNQFYNTTGFGPSLINPSGIFFHGQNLGSFVYQNNNLKITGAEIKTYKNPQSANVCSARLYYIIYPTAQVPAVPVFTALNIPFKADCNLGTGAFNDGLGPCVLGDQKWSTEALNINLTDLCPDNYTLEIYYDYSGDDEFLNGCGTTKTIINGESGNFKATFTITSSLSATAGTTTASICAGQSISLTSSGVLGKPPYSFSWAGPNSFSSISQNPGISNAVVAATGTYTVTVTDACGKTGTATVGVVVNALPSAPVATVTTQPNCTVPTGTVTITAPLGNNLQYSINGSVYQNGLVFSGVAPGTYTVTVKNTTTGCISAPLSLTVNTAPNVPVAPTATVTIQPACSISTGTIVITAPLGNNLQYSVDGSNYQSGVSFTGLVPGSYNVTVKNTTSGCISQPINLVVNPLPQTPAAATATVTVQPTCTILSGTIQITAPLGNNLQYSADGINYQSGLSFTLLAPGSYNITVKNITSGCISQPITLVVLPVPAIPAVPTATVTAQPTCTTTTGVITVTAPLGNNLEYSINGINFQPGLIFSGLVPGNYSVTVRNTGSGCTSQLTGLVVSPVPTPPAPPTISVVQPTCFVSTGTITMLTPTGNNFVYSINGTVYQAATVFSNVAPGNYNITVRNNLNGCTSGPLVQAINNVPPPPPAPAVTSPVNYCLNANAVALTATGTNLLWYGSAAGGTGSLNAPVPSTNTLGTVNYFVSQTSGICESQRSVIAVTINPLPTANAGNDKTIITGDPVTLDGSGTGFTSFNWNQNVGSATITPVVTPTVSTNYTLTTTNQFGCSANDAVFITVVPYCVKIMNAFTPNGDGINDRWLVTTGQSCTRAILVKVYNRYGGLVFENSNYLNEWDGTYKGKNVADATYYYIVEMTLINNQRLFLKGDVTILR